MPPQPAAEITGRRIVQDPENPPPAEGPLGGSADPFPVPIRHPMSGPRWRVAVVRADSARTRPLVAETTSQLRATGCMAVEIDATAVDPFVDIDSQWSPAVDADAYDLVVSIGRMLPAAVAIAALAGVPVAMLTSAPAPSVPAAIEQAVAAGRVRALPVLEVVADQARRVTMHGIDVHADPDSQLVAEIGQSHRARPLPGTAWSISPIPGPAGQLVVSPHGANAVHQADQVRLEGSPHALRLEIDGRARSAGHVHVRGIPQGLRVVDLDPAAA